ncbi:MAG: DUF1640 domain-containing protein [Acidimicrobiales bacterium]|nr:DUF1640 domain-containing protein [Acidimicrobiales bacterium]
MKVSNARRLQVYESLGEHLGTEAADTIMELLPIHPEPNLVTRTDMHANTLMLRGEMAALSSELKNDMTELRSELREEMTELRTDLRTEMAELRSELRGEMAELRSDLTSEMSRRFDSQTRWGVALIGSNIAALVTALAT